MVIRKPQYEKFNGDIDVDWPAGDFLQVAVTDKGITSNASLWKVWDHINQEAVSLSLNDAALTPVLERGLIEQTIKGINRSFVVIQEQVVTRVHSVFGGPHGGPPERQYLPYAIRWPGESRVGLNCVLAFVDTLFQIPRVQSNRLDRGILHDQALSILRALFNLKMDLMKEFFQKEIQGEVSVDELDAVFERGDIRPPLQWTLDDQRDRPEDTQSERDRALSEESATPPDAEEMDKITKGVEVWQWVPTKPDWVVFAKLAKEMTISGHSVKTPYEPFPFDTKLISGAKAKAPAKVR